MSPEAGYALKDCQFCDCWRGQKLLTFWQGQESKAHQRKLDGLFANAGIPAHFRDLTIDTMIERAGTDKGKKAAIDAVIDLVDHGYVLDAQLPKPGLVLSGDFGRGKTGLLTPVLRHHVEQGRTGLWVEVYDFIAEVQRGYSDGQSNARMDAAQRADIILLDDLGDKARGKEETDDRRRIVYQLINYRHNHKLPMLITTNLTGKEMAVQFGARTFERIVESCAWVSMSGKNLRLEA
jgi:DNA replication protein DnaC